MIRVPLISTLVLALTIACGNADRRPRACQQDSECPSATYCLTGLCIAGQLPQARIKIVAAEGAIVSHRLVTFDGAASTDPNPQHKLTGYRWAVSPASQASCEPSPATGAEAALTTVFQCPGEYEVQLTVKNSLGLESAPVAQALSVGRSTNPPAIQGQTPDLVFDHRCAGSPLVCQPVTPLGNGRFALSVDAADVESGGAVAYAWEVDAPPGADRSAVTFEPDRFSRTPTVRIASGGAIAGDWTFRVLAMDGDGLTTPAQVKVTIANQPPALSSDVSQVAFPHVYADNVYRAHGTVKFSAADPEGDAVSSPEVKLVESEPTECVFAVPAIASPSPGSYEATAELTCARPDQLIGTVTRHLEVALHDSSGAGATLSLPFTALDSPPTLQVFTVTTDHRVQACPTPSGSCFAAAGRVPALVDPDGDPVRLVALSPVGLDQGIWSADVASGSFTVQTSVSFPGSFRSANGTSPVSVRATVADPWGSVDRTFALAIPNHPPRAVATTRASPPLTYSVDTYLAQAAVATFVDDDGDPISGLQGSGDPACSVALAPGGAVQATCARPFDWTTGSSPNLSGFVGAALTVNASLSDPWERSATASSSVTPAAPAAPTIAGGYSFPVTCGCRCNVPSEPCEEIVPCKTVGYRPGVTSGGLPVHVTINEYPGTSFNCLGGSCTGGLSVNVCGSVGFTVVASNGWSYTDPQIVRISSYCSNTCR